MFIEQAWYVAAATDEIKPEPLARTILDQPIVLFRQADGAPCALLDRCPHRYLPLSKGQVVDDGLRCGYHGLTFDGSGACVRVPTQDQIPGNARVRSFPLVERYGFAWIWMGDPARADPAEIPSFDIGIGLDHHLSPAWGSAWGYYNPKASYLLIVDNLLDLSHVTLVHSSTLAAGGFDNAEGNVEVSGSRISDRRVTRGIKAGEGFGPMFGGNADTLIDYWLEMHWLAPSNLLLDVYLPHAGTDKNAGIRFLSSQLITPETATSSHYYWVSSRNFNVDDDQYTAEWAKVVEFAFGEDSAVLTAQQAALGDRDVMDLSPVFLRSDHSAIQARREIKRLAELQKPMT